MSTADNKIRLLAKLLKEDIENNKVNEDFNDIYTTIKVDFIPKLEKSTFPSKTRILANIESYLEWIESLVNVNDLVGNSFIGVLGSDYGSCKNIINKLIEEDSEKLYMNNTNIPALIVNDDNKEIKLLNRLDNEVMLSRSEYEVTTKELYKSKIDIREFIKVFTFKENIKLKNTGIAYLPDYCTRTSQHFENILEYSNSIFIYANEKNNWKFNLKNLSHISYKKDICIFVKNENINEVKEYISTQDVGLLNINIYNINENFNNIIEKYDYSVNEINITDKLISILNEIELYYFNHIEKQKTRLNYINKDLVSIADNSTKESIKEIRKNIILTLENEEKLYYELKKEIDLLLSKVKELDERFLNIFKEKNNNVTVVTPSLQQLWVKIALQMIDMKNIKKCKLYINKLERSNYKYTFIINMLLNSKMKIKVEYSNIAMLNNTSNDNYLVYKAKIVFRNQLGLDDCKAGEMFFKIPRCYRDKHYEYFVAGVYLEKSNYKKAIELYYEALELGSIKSGERLLQLAKNDSSIDKEYLAKNMVPAANYEVGMNYINNNRYAKGLTYVKIAAALENLSAIKYLADNQYNKIIKNYRYKQENSSFSVESNKLLQLYSYLLSKSKNDKDIIEKIGFIYLAIEDYRRAVEFLSKSGTAYALYSCGNIYQYGKGTIAQDIYEAKKIFKKAADLGHTKAKVEYEKVCGWIQANEYKTQARKSSNYSTTSSYSYESSSGGLCFITTATCVALNKEDDCEELLAFKHYRDTVLIYESDGLELIREYYRIAPRIVEAIENEEDSKQLYQKLWDDYIIVGYKYLLKNDMIKAKETYMNMVLSLCKKYKVNCLQL